MPFAFLRPDPSLDRADRVQFYVAVGLRLVLFGEIVLSVWQGNLLTAAVATGILALALVPVLIRRRFQIYLPLEFDLLTVVFVFASLFLGEMRSYYMRYWWWDAVLHTSAGFLLGLFGFLLVYVLNREQRGRLTMSPFFMGFFAFAFAEAVGVIWEIFEFGMDTFFGLNMQKSGLPDTMADLIVNTIGAAVVATLGTLYVRGGDSLLFDRFVRRFLEGNYGLRSARWAAWRYRRKGGADGGRAGSDDAPEG